MAEPHLAVLMLEMLIEPQARTGLVRTEASCVARKDPSLLNKVSAIRSD